MKVKELIKQDAGFQYVVDSMELMSSAGRRVMLDTRFETDGRRLEAEWQRVATMVGVAQVADSKKSYTDLMHCLMQLHDLQGTLSSLALHSPLNEVELFEIKNLALLCGKARLAVKALGIEPLLPLPDLSEVFALLDPDHTGIASFYIYDSYHDRLAPLRRELKALQATGEEAARIAVLIAEQNELQAAVCSRLSDALHSHHRDLAEALETMAYADFLQAKAALVMRWGLTRPALGEQTVYHGLFNPRLRQHNEQQGLRYQPVDISLGQGVTLITGANMAGKTVLLKSVATAQLMVQCGLFAPAAEAKVVAVDDVVRSIGDGQDEMNGLSSYASEITTISNIVGRSRAERLLIVIDEPARTTNPTEGKALVQALVDLLGRSASVSLVTTHYDSLGSSCRRLRVRGFVEDMVNVPLNAHNINRFIDYSLTEDRTDDVPHEALRIAEILSCDGELLALARRNLV